MVIDGCIDNKVIRVGVVSSDNDNDKYKSVVINKSATDEGVIMGVVKWNKSSVSVG